MTQPPSAEQLAMEPSLWGRVVTERAEKLPDADAESRRVAQLELATLALSATNIATAHDAAWRALHQIRHLDCEYAKQSKLIRIASDLTADIKYHPRQEDLAKELDAIQKTLSACVLEEEALNAQRPVLLRLSTLAAEERESSWRQANRSIVRRRKAAFLLLVFAIGLGLFIPAVMLENFDGSEWLTLVLRYYVMGGCGALGGLLSGLIKDDRMNAASIEHHLEQLRFSLRPRIGFVAALIAALIAGTGTVAGGDITQGIGPELLLLAVAAGFSERFLLGHIENLADKSTPKTNESTKT